MRVVVTGAGGFVGSALLAELRVLQIDAVGVVRSQADLPGCVRVAHYGESPDGDVLVHLAETRDLAAADANPDRHIANAVELAESLLDRGYDRVVYASSAVVYGDGSVHARRPDEPPPAAVGAYARGKLAVETLMLGRRDAAVARIANVYGRGMARGSVLAEVLDQKERAGPIRVRDGAPVRDFIAIRDVARALTAMALGKTAGIYNVGTGIATSVSALAKLVAELCGQPDRQVVATRPAESLSHLVLDVTATEHALGWRAETSLRNGLKSLIEDWR